MPRKKKVESTVSESQAVANRAALEHSATALISTLENPIMVPVKNYGGTNITFVYEFRGSKKSLDLETTGRRTMGAVPIEVWEDMQRNTKLVDEGYVARTDIPTDNPNVVESVEELVDTLSEKAFKTRINKIVNPNVLFRFVAYIEPLKDKDGRLLAAQRVVRDRVEALTGTRIVDEE